MAADVEQESKEKFEFIIKLLTSLSSKVLNAHDQFLIDQIVSKKQEEKVEIYIAPEI